MRRLVFYISHIYDVTLFIRIIEEYKELIDKSDIEFLICPKIKIQIGTNLSELSKFGNLNFIPTEFSYSQGIIKSFLNSIKIKNWLNIIGLTNCKLISTDKSQFLSLLLLGHFNDIVLIQQVEKFDKNYFFSLKYTIYFNFFHLITSSKFMLYFKMIKSNGHVVGLKFLKDYKKNTIYLTKESSTYPSFNLPFIKSTNSSRNVVIFGSRYNDWKFVDLPNFKIILFQCYLKIKEIYFDKEIIYIPHPLERGSEFEELNELFNYKLVKIDPKISSEYYLYSNADTIITFSIGSTSSQSALNMGIPSKVFYKILDLSDEMKLVFDQLFLDFPEVFFIKNSSEEEEFLVDNMIDYFSKMEVNIKSMTQLKDVLF